MPRLAMLGNSVWAGKIRSQKHQKQVFNYLIFCEFFNKKSSVFSAFFLNGSASLFCKRGNKQLNQMVA